MSILHFSTRRKNKSKRFMNKENVTNKNGKNRYLFFKTFERKSVVDIYIFMAKDVCRYKFKLIDITYVHQNLTNPMYFYSNTCAYIK